MKRVIPFLFKAFVCSLLLMDIETVNAQQKSNLNVAIVLWENVELLDFAGPGEVFAAAGFNVYTVSVEGQQILSQRFVTVKPEYSIDNAPTPDIIVFPGGGTGAVDQNPKVLEWIKNLSARGSMMLSVCTGAFILNNASLLDGKNVTTHYSSTQRLQTLNPKLKVLENTRFVDNGNVLTTAGVSAGIDGALHVVRKIKGLEAAKATARYMEYDKWNPDEGRVDFSNEYLKALRDYAYGINDKVRASFPAGISAPFEGELVNLAMELQEQKKFKEAVFVYEQCLKLYPLSGKCYRELHKLYTALGKPVPIGETAFMSLLKEGRIDEAEKQFRDARKKFPGWILFDRGETLNVAYRQYYTVKDYQGALRITKLAAESYPDSHFAFYSLGEIYQAIGDKSNAIASFKKSLELNPLFKNSQKMLDELLRNN
jgi:putative intracellular protease/amidase